MREAVHRERHEEGTDRIMVEKSLPSAYQMQALEMVHPARYARVRRPQ